MPMGTRYATWGARGPPSRTYPGWWPRRARIGSTSAASSSRRNRVLLPGDGAALRRTLATGTSGGPETFTTTARENELHELIIIGGGPAGYTAALFAARADLQPLVIEGFHWGGQLMITSDVENYPGYPEGVMGPEMMSEFRRQAERCGAEFVPDDVTRVDFSEQPLRIWVEDEE